MSDVRNKVAAAIARTARLSGGYGGYDIDDVDIPPEFDNPEECADAAITAHIEALREAGMVVVPVEPTEAQRLNGARAIGNTMRYPNHTERARVAWAAMLPDAPEQPVPLTAAQGK